MTNKEQINYIKEWLKDEYALNAKDREVLTAAIKALEQQDDVVSQGVFEQVMWERDIAIEQLKELGYGFGEKIRQNDDCISRQAVLELAKKGVLISNGNYNSVCNAINDIPSIQPEQKTGHWIRVVDKTGHLVWECDKCGWQQRFNTNFCPDCGKKMVEPQERSVEE